MLLRRDILIVLLTLSVAAALYVASFAISWRGCELRGFSGFRSEESPIPRPCRPSG
jgi:hypothetical protein